MEKMIKKKAFTYTEIVLFIITAILFTNNHLLYVLMVDLPESIWFGIPVTIILVDFILYLAVFLQVIGIMILLEEKINLYIKIKKNEEIDLENE